MRSKKPCFKSVKFNLEAEQDLLRQRISLSRKELLLTVKCFNLCLLNALFKFSTIFKHVFNIFNIFNICNFYFQQVLNFSTFWYLKFSTRFQHLLYLYRFNFVFSLFFSCTPSHLVSLYLQTLSKSCTATVF